MRQMGIETTTKTQTLTPLPPVRSRTRHAHTHTLSLTPSHTHRQPDLAHTRTDRQACRATGKRGGSWAWGWCDSCCLSYRMTWTAIAERLPAPQPPVRPR
eukprot:1728022-Rhodomonas_salina.2